MIRRMFRWVIGGFAACALALLGAVLFLSQRLGSTSSPAGDGGVTQSDAAATKDWKDNDSLWTQSGPRPADRTGKAQTYRAMALSLDRMGLGPIDAGNVEVVVTDGARALVQIGSGGDSARTHAVVDLRSMEVTSFVPMGSCRTTLPGGGLAFVEKDRAWIYRKGWTQLREVPGSRLSPDQSYAASGQNERSCPGREQDGQLALKADPTDPAGTLPGSNYPRVEKRVALPLDEPAT